jgi:MOSC domain-containing protein YiiM
MSNHFSAAKLQHPGDDARLDLTDLFVFAAPGNPDRTVLIMNSNPFTKGNGFHPDAVYRFNIDTDGDALADVAFSFTFSELKDGRQTGTAYYATGSAAAAAAKATERNSPVPVLVSVNVGMPKDVPWHGKTVRTGVWKYPAPGPRMVRRLNIDGDGQGDLNGHGGEQRAVLVYQVDSYRHWQQHFGRDDFSYGQFGENITVDGMADDEVCIGDRYRIGEAEFEVTQPRVTCYRVGLRLGEPELPALLVSHHRPGFYMRVITEGHIQPGDAIVKTRTGPGALSVADTDALLYLPGRDPGKLRAALQIPALSPGWQGSFRDLVAGAEGDGAAGAPPPPAWPAFRELRVAEVVRESKSLSDLIAPASGTVLTRMAALVYIAGLAPEEGETVGDVFYRGEPHPKAPELKPDSHGLVWLPDEAFADAFAQNASRRSRQSWPQCSAPSMWPPSAYRSSGPHGKTDPAGPWSLRRTA